LKYFLRGENHDRKQFRNIFLYYDSGACGARNFLYWPDAAKFF